MSDALQLHVDAAVCQGHGRCYALAPGLFAADDVDGHAVLRVAGPVPEHLLDAARRAEAACPERAIRLLPAAPGAE